MSNLSDYQKFSNYVNGIVDRKIKAIAMGVTTSTGYFKVLINQASAQATLATAKALASQNSAVEAQTAAATSTIIWNNFTSIYAGTATNDPQVSSIGNPLVKGAFYIRSSDNRLRIATAINGSGIATWNDATVVADVDSVVAAANGRFLSLSNTTLQTILGPVRFDAIPSVPTVTDWESSQAANAASVKELVDVVKGNLAAEVIRAKAAEQAGALFTQNEITRATNAENALSTAISNEVTRSTNADNTFSQTATNLGNAILGETNRATGVENTLSGNITTVSGNVTTLSGNVTTVSQNLTNFMNSFENGSNEYGYWEKRPGVVEMWGNVSATATSEITVPVNFPLEVSNTDYVITFGPEVAVAGSLQDLWTQAVRNTKSVLGFTVQYQADDNGDRRLDGFGWRIIHRGTATVRSSPPGGGFGGGGNGGGGGGGDGTQPQ